MTGVFTLNCLLLGDEPQNIISVKIAKTENVFYLKQAIKETKKPQLDDYSADSLELWKVSIAVDSMLHARLEQFRLEPDKDIYALASPLDYLSEHFSEGILDKHLHIIVQTPLKDVAQRRRKRSPEEQHIGEGSRKTLKRITETTKDLLPWELDLLNQLYENIRLISNNPEDYSDPNHKIQLPFLSANEIPMRFAISDNGSVSYFGRESFALVWEALCQIAEDVRRRRAIYIYGSKGYGKSHICLALACLLARRGHRVVFIPDYHRFFLDPFDYLRKALLVAFADSGSSITREKIQQCENTTALADFCYKYRLVGNLYFIVDQLYTLDLKPFGQQHATGDTKSQPHELLGRMSALHISIWCASANDAGDMDKEDTDAKNILLIGGMTKAEMSCWWQRHDTRFANFNATDRERVEDLTGCIPLLLTPFLVQPQATPDTLEPLIWKDRVLASVGEDVIGFAEEKRSNLSHQTFQERFVPLMRACLTGDGISASGRLLDRRYFYFDSEGRGRYTCGLARQAITKFLRLRGEESIFLGAEWLQTLRDYRHNRSAVGFTVQQIVISKLASAGIRSGDFVIPPGKIVTFEGDTPPLSKDKKTGLLSIDALFVSFDLKANTAIAVGIQITVAKKHKDTEAAFFGDLHKWFIVLEGIEVTASFLWIHEDRRGRDEVEKDFTALRRKTIQHWPAHGVNWVSIEQVDKDLAHTLAEIRPATHDGCGDGGEAMSAGSYVPNSPPRNERDSGDSLEQRFFDGKSTVFKKASEQILRKFKGKDKAGA